MNIEVEKTREYYGAISEESLCGCGYCRSFREQVRSAYPEAAAYLDAFGIAMEKAMETSPLEPEEDGTLVYCGCQYPVFGTCQPEYRHSTGGVEFRVATSYPPTGIEDAHFVLECFPIKLKFHKGV